MRGLLGLALTLSACSTCDTLDYVQVEYETYSGTVEMAWYTSDLYARWLQDDVCLREIRIDPDFDKSGRYNTISKKVTVAESDSLDWDRFVIGHEICHAVHAQWSLPTQDLVSAETKKASKERFADLCTLGRDTWDAVGHDECGFGDDYKDFTNVAREVFGAPRGSHTSWNEKLEVELDAYELTDAWITPGRSLCVEASQRTHCWSMTGQETSDDGLGEVPGEPELLLQVAGLKGVSGASAKGLQHRIMVPRGRYGPEGGRPLFAEGGGARLVTLDGPEVVNSTCVADQAFLATSDGEVWLAELVPGGKIRWSIW